MKKQISIEDFEDFNPQILLATGGDYYIKRLFFIWSTDESKQKYVVNIKGNNFTFKDLDSAIKEYNNL